MLNCAEVVWCQLVQLPTQCQGQLFGPRNNSLYCKCQVQKNSMSLGTRICCVKRAFECQCSLDALVSLGPMCHTVTEVAVSWYQIFPYSLEPIVLQLAIQHVSSVNVACQFLCVSTTNELNGTLLFTAIVLLRILCQPSKLQSRFLSVIFQRKIAYLEFCVQVRCVVQSASRSVFL